MPSVLERRLEALEAATDPDGGGGCDRCIGILTTIHETPSVDFSSAE